MTTDRDIKKAIRKAQLATWEAYGWKKYLSVGWWLTAIGLIRGIYFV